jgi:hypothetical protein
MVKDVFFNSSATSSLNEANESSEDNNLTAPLISKSATFASTFLPRQTLKALYRRKAKDSQRKRLIWSKDNY